MSADAAQTHHDSILGATGAGVASVPTVDAAVVLRWHTPFGPFWGRLYCRRCKREWRGDAETGGCTAVLLARRAALLEGLLREAEWAGDTEVDRCPLCERPKPVGHVSDCRLVAALADGG